MHERVLRKIACLLIAMLLATVLSPSFGWEAVASQSAHGHGVLAMDNHDGHAGQHQGDEDSHHHHGCTGHLLGHLLAQLSNPLPFAILDPAGSVFPELPSDFSSRVPERLDRPPLAPALA
jgi:hypothetical protein